MNLFQHKTLESNSNAHIDREISDWSKLPSDPLLSVAMIAYNHKDYIREAIDSVLMQKVSFPYEICIGEDGSTDGTREICLEYATKYPERSDFSCAIVKIQRD